MRKNGESLRDKRVLNFVDIFNPYLGKKTTQLNSCVKTVVGLKIL